MRSCVSTTSAIPAPYPRRCTRPEPTAEAPRVRRLAPRFIDYLYLGFTNATAFSPTGVVPLAPRAKIAMVVQSLVSLGILGLVIARAVNVFT